MATKQAAPLQTFSRFAILNEGSDSFDSDSDDEKPKAKKKEATPKTVSNAEKNAKKRARKKKKAASEQASKNELRDMAFSKPVSSKAIQAVQQSLHPLPVQNVDVSTTLPSDSTNPVPDISTNPVPDILAGDHMSWEEWRMKDEEIVRDQFQRDLDAALRMSTDDIQNQRDNSKQVNAKREKKKQTKQKTMTLSEFSAAVPDETPPAHHPDVTFPSSFVNMNLCDFNEYTPTINTGPRHVNGYCPEEVDPSYNDHYIDEDYNDDAKFPMDSSSHRADSKLTNNHNSETTIDPRKDAADSSSHRKKKKEKPKKMDLSDLLDTELDEVIENHDSKVPGMGLDAASLAVWQDTVEKKDKEISKIKKIALAFKEELAQVKKRNNQLCFILGQGEMKDKSEILEQVQELTASKEELSTELTDMYSQLEQERSKVSSLKLELAKYQTGRVKAKSVSEEK